MTSKQYRELLRRSVRYIHGDKCKTCGAKQHLELAHVAPTNLTGTGRGSKERLIDAIKNPKSYLLLCDKCHRLHHLQPIIDNPDF